MFLHRTMVLGKWELKFHESCIEIHGPYDYTGTFQTKSIPTMDDVYALENLINLGAGVHAENARRVLNVKRDMAGNDTVLRVTNVLEKVPIDAPRGRCNWELVPWRNLSVIKVSLTKIRCKRGTRIDDQELIDKLAVSMDVEGLQQAITVRPVPRNRFEIMDGRMRFLAAKKLNWVTIEAMVVPLEVK